MCIDILIKILKIIEMKVTLITGPVIKMSSSQRICSFLNLKELGFSKARMNGTNSLLVLHSILLVLETNGRLICVGQRAKAI